MGDEINARLYDLDTIYTWMFVLLMVSHSSYSDISAVVMLTTEAGEKKGAR
jgi:hypothetical protein